MVVDDVILEERLRACLLEPEALLAKVREDDARRVGQGLEFARCAILVPIMRRDTGSTLLLTRRASGLPVSPGALVFPGGHEHPEDRDVIATALREAEEEVAIPGDRCRLLGGLEVEVAHPAYRMAFVVGCFDADVVALHAPREVESVHEVPLDFAFDPTNHQLREYRLEERSLLLDTIVYQDLTIWGLSATVIRTLAERLASGAAAKLLPG
jgi:8-oxo-dGTP pyrophosphatase MutT (NUDIX family)